ncbi:DUF624 domain-containing protein [Lactiplantibacillus modestisalitolerans]|uniref:DUF624 domain-containing protein n=1 Tax=Lactiplantibacillus modestisalitolerans TaxID=1457219 RepID=A0ABV5WSB8_9LACO|nr:DUF624 domain-containing protein [Lactiplantibacillus modestisalitolerans]
MAIGRAADKIFTRVFIVFIMTIYFWLFACAGLLIFGIGPAARTVTELYMDGQWDYHEYGLKKGWRRFRTDFWRINAHTWLFLGAGLVLAYNLYLSTTIKGAYWLVFVQFIIVAALIFDFCLAIFTLMTRSRYAVSFKNAVKLAIVQFFNNFMQLLGFIIMTGVLILISLKWPGMILFLSPGIYVVVADILSHQWYAKVDQQLGAG